MRNDHSINLQHLQRLELFIRNGGISRTTKDPLCKKISHNRDFYHIHLSPKSFLVNSPFRSVHNRSNSPVISDLTESWWACAIQVGRVFGPFGWTKGRPHNRDLTGFYPKLALWRALPHIYIYIYIYTEIFRLRLVLTMLR